MQGFFDWFVHIPTYLSGFGNWLITPLSDLIPISPLAVLGTSALTFVGVVLVAKIVHLIIG